MDWLHDDTLVPPGERVTDYILGLDLGQSQDFTALAVLQRASFPWLGKPTRYTCRVLRRWPVGTPYPEIAHSLRELMETRTASALLPLAGAPLVVDATGVGRAVVDLVRPIPQPPGYVTSVVLTAGHTTTFEPSADAW